MKILHINTNYINNPLHQNMVNSLEKTGISNFVYVPTHDAASKVIKPEKYVSISECFKKWDRVFYYNKQKKILNDIQNKFTISNFDILHAYTLFTDGNVAYSLYEKYKIPYVVAVRNTDVNTFLKYMIHLRKRGIEILKNASAVFFLSNAYKNQVFNKYLNDSDKKVIDPKTYIMPNGVDDFWIENAYNQERKLDGNKVKICFAGKIDKNKNCGLTVKACDLLMKKGYDISYTMVGKLVDTSFENIISSKKYINHIAFMPKEKLIDIYRQNDIFVMPSYTESFGMVYVEAMSQGLPVIYTEGEGFDGQFAEGKVGYHSSSSDCEQLAEKIKKIIDNYESISSNCPKCLENFKWEIIAQKYKKIYSEIEKGI